MIILIHEQHFMGYDSTWGQAEKNEEYFYDHQWWITLHDVTNDNLYKLNIYSMVFTKL